MHKHPNHDLVDLMSVPVRKPNLGGSTIKQSTQFLHGSSVGGLFASSVVLLFGRRGVAVAITVLALLLGESVSNHLGCEEEVVVVNDNEITGLVDLCYLGRKELVGLEVGCPRGVRSGDSSGSIEP